MHPSSFATLLLLSLVAIGCVHEPKRVRDQKLVFNIRSSDVVSVSAEPVDSSRLPGREIPLAFKAQLHVVLNDAAAERFRSFQESYEGRVFELQINGDVLLSAVSAYPHRASEIAWFVVTMEEAKRFAASLNKK